METLAALPIPSFELHEDYGCELEFPIGIYTVTIVVCICC